MSENADDAQERTEEATPKRLREAREKGQIPRSKELTTAAVVVGGTGALLILGRQIANDLVMIAHQTMSVSPEQLFDQNFLVVALIQSVMGGMKSIFLFLIICMAVALGGSVLLGGMPFNAISFRMDKWNVLAGIRRMFSSQALMELAKALAKFLVVAVIGFIVIWTRMDDLLALMDYSLGPAINEGVWILGWSLLMMSAGLIVIAAIDVPFQLWHYASQLKMTHQELKDEYKETEGRPEVKQKQRRKQYEISKRRMMQAIPKADVVITNPEHFAVALAYDRHREGSAPKVVAKGADLIALQIKRVALANSVLILSAPPLARALFYSTEMDQEIPAGLYVSVAQVLAYVYQLRRYNRKGGTKPTYPKDFHIPDELKVDESGVRHGSSRGKQPR